MSSLNDIEICNKIAQCLFDNAPVGPKKIVMRADLAEEGDACQFEFDWVNKENEVNWFMPEGLAGTILTELLASHRAYFVSANQRPWKSCQFTVDVEGGKFSMELFYGDDGITYPAC